MDSEWNDSQPIYRQLRDRVVAHDPRRRAQGRRSAPLRPQCRGGISGQSAHRSQGLPAIGRTSNWSRSKRGLGMFVKAGARDLLLKGEREKFLAEQWPRVAATIERLGSDAGGIAECRRGAGRSTRKRRNAEAMACIEARGLRKTLATTVALDGIDLARRGGPHPRAHRPERRRQNHRAQRHSRTHFLRGRIESARTRSVDGARRADARCLFHRRCRGAAALDAGGAVARLRGRRASAIRSREGGAFSGQDHDQAHEQSAAVIERHGGAAASRARHGDRRETARAR